MNLLKIRLGNITNYRNFNFSKNCLNRTKTHALENTPITKLYQIIKTAVNITKNEPTKSTNPNKKSI